MGSLGYPQMALPLQPTYTEAGPEPTQDAATGWGTTSVYLGDSEEREGGLNNTIEASTEKAAKADCPSAKGEQVKKEDFEKLKAEYANHSLTRNNF